MRSHEAFRLPLPLRVSRLSGVAHDRMAPDPRSRGHALDVRSDRIGFIPGHRPKHCDSATKCLSCWRPKMPPEELVVGSADRALENDAKEILNRLTVAGITIIQIEADTGIHRGTLSAYRAGTRRANEDNYRIIAKYGVANKVFPKSKK